MKARGIKGLMGWLIALALAVPCAAAASDAANPPLLQSAQADEELAEVLVTGRHARNPDPQTYFNWLARLVGEFTVDGYVDPDPRGAPHDLLGVQGKASCFGFGAGPGVECELRVRWPETRVPDGEAIAVGLPTLDPAVMLFGFNVGGFNQPDYGIHHVLVDNLGISESGVGVYEGADTVVFRSHCAAVRVDCERVTHITASPDLKSVDINIELTIEARKAVRYMFVMHRVPGSRSVVYGRPPEQEEQK